MIEDSAKESEEIIARAKERALSVTAQAMRLGIKQVEQEVDHLLGEIKRLEAEVFSVVQNMPQNVERIIDGNLAELSQKVERAQIPFTDSKQVEGKVPGTGQNAAKSQPSYVSEKDDRTADVVEMSQKVEGSQILVTDSKPLEGKAAPATRQDAPKSEPGYLSELCSQKGAKTTELAERDDLVCEGVLKLETTNATGPSLIRFNEFLSKLSGVTLMSTAGSYEGKASKTIYSVSLERPMPLIKVLRGIPVVEVISTRNRDIVLKLRQDLS